MRIQLYIPPPWIRNFYFFLLGKIFDDQSSPPPHPPTFNLLPMPLKKLFQMIEPVVTSIAFCFTIFWIWEELTLKKTTF